MLGRLISAGEVEGSSRTATPSRGEIDLSSCLRGIASVRFPILFALLVCASGAFGQRNSSFYVSTTGDDSNPGTLTAPCRTVQHAADMVRAGGTVNVRGGIYEELLSINASGNSSDGF